jgi:hypothetical protein
MLPGSIHASTGILPVKDITLPDQFVINAIKQMELMFRVESLLTDSSKIYIPKLTEQNGNWSWINHTSVEDYTSESVNYATNVAKLSSASVMVRDGWLRLEQAEKIQTNAQKPKE